MKSIIFIRLGHLRALIVIFTIIDRKRKWGEPGAEDTGPLAALKRKTGSLLRPFKNIFK
jgi:hypothetical protein